LSMASTKGTISALHTFMAMRMTITRSNLLRAQEKDARWYHKHARQEGQRLAAFSTQTTQKMRECV
jgi:hypothetical protein